MKENLHYPLQNANFPFTKFAFFAGEELCPSKQTNSKSEEAMNSKNATQHLAIT